MVPDECQKINIVTIRHTTDGMSGRDVTRSVGEGQRVFQSDF